MPHQPGGASLFVLDFAYFFFAPGIIPLSLSMKPV
jgi:hypothetical protein